MTLGKKVGLAIVVFGAVLTFGTWAVLRVTVLPAFEQLEIETVEKDRSKILSKFVSGLEALSLLNEALSAWTPVYEEIQRSRTGFLEANLNTDNIPQKDMDILIAYDRYGVYRYGWARHPQTLEMLDVQQELPFDVGRPTADQYEQLKNTMGLVRGRRGFIQLVAMPITTSDAKAEPVGWLLSGRYLTDSVINELARQVNATLTLSYASERAAGEIPTDLIPSDEVPYTTTVNDEFVVLSQPIFDIFGAEIGVMEIESERVVTAVGKRSIQYALSAFAVAMVLLMLVATRFLHVQIVSPIKELTALMQRMLRTGNLKVVAQTDRTDEIGTLAGRFNELTRELRSAQVELEGARDEAVELANSKSEFLARMSHEIRTPMNGVIGMTELLKNTQLSDRQVRCVKTIGESGNTLLTLINDILDFSKIEAGKLNLENKPVDLRELVEETAAGFTESASHKGVELITAMPIESPSRVITDPTRLRQVLVNLLGNALKFTAEGEVRLSLMTSEKDGVVQAAFEITDTGIGIQHDKQRDIFEAFTQEDGSTTRVYGGSGLGLAISRQIVSLLGGELELDSEPGVGSCFHFTLRFDFADDGVEPSTWPQRILDGKRVLVADPSRGWCDIFDDALYYWGAEVVTTHKASKAIRLLETDKFDIAIVDACLDRPDGDLLLPSVAELAPGTTIISTSVLAKMPKPSRLEKWNVEAHITKPLRLGELQRVLSSAMEGIEQQPEQDQLTGKAGLLGGRVLLAEDNRVNQMVAISMLKLLGLEVVLAENGEEALERCITDDFDLVLMDCQMPVMDGFEATAEIRAWEAKTLAKRIPIVALTANALKGDRERCLDAGMDEYLTKPFKTEELQAILAPWLLKQPAKSAS